MLPYYLIGLICDYLDKTKDRFNLHVCCQYYYHNYMKEGHDLCWDCDKYLDKWERKCDHCDDYYHEWCGQFEIINNSNLCRRCYGERCQSCFKTIYEKGKCIFCFTLVGYCCTQYYYEYSITIRESIVPCICIACRNKVKYLCYDCQHVFMPEGPTYLVCGDDTCCGQCGGDDCGLEYDPF